MEQNMTFNLLTVMGKVKTDSVEATRQLHNQTAGNPEGVTAAKSLGDMSHMTYMSLDADKSFKGDLLFLDIWNNLEGMNAFFSDKQVQTGGEMLFSSRDAIVWSKLDGFLNFRFPSPFGKNERIVGLVQGKVNSIEEAQAIHNKSMATQIKSARANGLVSHEFYVRMAAPGSSEALETLGVDMWMDPEGMMEHYSSPEFRKSGLYTMFSEKAATSIWIHPKGEWVEW